MAWEEWQFSNNKTHSHQSDAKGWKIFMSTLLNWLRCKKSHSKRPSPVKVADGRSDSLLPTKSLNRARTLREYHFNQRFISFVFINYSFFKLRWRLRAPSSIRSSRLPSKCLQRQKDRHYYLSSHSFEEKITVWRWKLASIRGRRIQGLETTDVWWRYSSTVCSKPKNNKDYERVKKEKNISNAGSIIVASFLVTGHVNTTERYSQ